MSENEINLSGLAPDVDTAPGLAAIRSRRRARALRRFALGVVVLVVAAAASVVAWPDSADSPTEVADGPATSAPTVPSSPASPPSTDPVPVPDPEACGPAAFAGVRLDSRAWDVRSGELVYRLAVTEPCLLTAMEVVAIHDDGWREPVEPSDPDVAPSVGDPMILLPDQPVDVVVSDAHESASGCDSSSAPIGGFGVEIGGFTAQSTPTAVEWCRAEHALVEPDDRSGTLVPLGSVSMCSAATGLTPTGAVDFAGTLNTTFSNRGTTACRIESVSVAGYRAGGTGVRTGSTLALEPVIDPPAGIPPGVLPLVIGPGRGVAVMVVTPLSLAVECAAVSEVAVTEFVIEVAGNSVDVDADRPYGVCSTAYTTRLLDPARLTLETGEFVDLDGRVCLLSNPAHCEDPILPS